MASVSDGDGAQQRLFGREHDLAVLDDLISSARDGHGASVLIEGEPGIGKTALLETLSDRCRVAGFYVARGTAEELEQRVPFQAVRSLLSPVAEPSSEVRLRHQDANAPFPAFGAAERIQYLLTDRCDEIPVALLLDDLQWADPSSLAVLQRIQRRAAGLSLLIGMTVHPIASSSGHASSLLAIKSAVDRRLPLCPLAEEDVFRLTSSLLGARPGPELMDRVSAAAGNALFITELVGALSFQGHLSTANGVVDLVSTAIGVTALPTSVNETILQRMDLLSHETRDLLEVCAVMGPRVHLADLATVLGAPAMQVWQQVREAVEVGLLVESGDRLEFRHNMVRRALLDVMPRSVWMALQQQAGRALAAADAPPEQVARHLLLADVTLGHGALDWLTRSAPRLAARSPEDAVDLLERAVAELQCHDVRHPALVLQLTHVLLQTNDNARAERTARTALAVVGEGDADVSLHRLMAWSIFKQGEVGRALEEACRALRSWPDDVRLNAFVALCHFMLGSLPDCEKAAYKALAAAEHGGRYMAVYGHAALATLRLREMRSGEALERADEALALLGHHAIDPELPMDPHYTRGVALMDLDRCAEAESAFAQGLAACEDGVGAFLTAFHVGRTWLFFRTGRWEDAMAEVGAGLEAVDHLGMHATLRLQAALIARHRGALVSPAFSNPQLNDSSPGSTSAQVYYQGWVRALSQEANGDDEGALHSLFGAWERGLAEVGPRALYDLSPDAARLAAEVGDKDRLRRLCLALSDQAPVIGQTANARAVQLLSEGLLADDAESLLQASDLFHSSRHLLYEAYARERSVVLLAQSGQTDAARKALNETLVCYGSLGATWDAARAERLFAAAGLRWRRRSSWRPSVGWESLTETENRIVAHVAAGCSNPDIAARLFLSPRTIQFHLASIFGKLDIGSRVELAVRASQEDHGSSWDDGEGFAAS
ncbi:helix-turn-helix transcriptional regulator [Streptomyces chartreusis]